MIRIVLVDDHGLMRAGVRMILEAEPDLQVVGEAGSGDEALPLLRKLKPDVVLCDFHMPGLSGLEVTERLARSLPDVRLIMVSVLNEGPIPKRVLAAGAYGYLDKGAPGPELLTAVREVAAGRRYIGTSIARQIAMEGLSGTPSAVQTLTPRELEVALLLVQGRKMTEIGQRLSLSAKTVATHKYRVFDKLGVRDVVSLARIARQHGLVDPNAN
ncbi:response regulator [Aquimonas voraii]|uniref:Two component transcriptional regulator, LuxR family n=1 Tax=Aquimonas voraii TaxID=265719 RepID=A0A1G6XS08_9GAMM|nr:response regulator [Aquimonas voraii]SDD80948.1 two component transcriptional regulator, LuxR family [Aquimonas voraii]